MAGFVRPSSKSYQRRLALSNEIRKGRTVDWLAIVKIADRVKCGLLLYRMDVVLYEVFFAVLSDQSSLQMKEQGDYPPLSFRFWYHFVSL